MSKLDRQSDRTQGIPDVLALYKSNKLLFGKMYFPHYFRKESPPFHLNIINETSQNLDTAMHAPRGGAKSTVETFLDSVHGIALKRERFIVIVQNTYAKAAGSLNNIKFEIRYNESLKRDFGITMNVKDAEGDTIFTHPDGFMVRVLCKGADQLGSIRGERFGAYRPTLIIVDDLEDDEMVRNPERRQELEKQFNEVLNYAGEAGETRIVVIGTILHDDSLLAKLLASGQYKRFKKIFYDVITESDESLWPAKWSREDLRRMEAEDPSGFAKEMRGDPSSGSMETIRREDFRYWRIENNAAVLLNSDGSVHSMWPLSECKSAIAYDLAWEDKQVSDYSAIMPGLCTPANDILIDDYIMKKGLRPDELENIIFTMNERYEKITGRRLPTCFEKAKLEKVMKWFLIEAQKRRGKYLWFKDISWGNKDKVERVISRVGNRYAQHTVYHKRGMGELENQLIRIRSSKHDDLADCVGILAEALAYSPFKSKKPVAVDNEFEWWRKKAIEARDGRSSGARGDKRYVIGGKSRAIGVAYTESYR